MDSPTRELVFALLGAVLGAGVVIAWWVSDQQQHRAAVAAQPLIPSGVATVLSVLRSSALVVDENDEVVKASAPAYAMGLVRNDRVQVAELLTVIRGVRRDGQIRETDLELMPGPASRLVTARVAPISSRLVLALVEDQTRARRLDEVRRDFVANVSHELKTPVGAVILLAEAIAGASDDPAAVERFADRIGVESRRLSHLVQQIIELSRLQGDDTPGSPVPVPVDAMLHEAIDKSAIDAAAKNIRLLVDADTGLAIEGNPGQVGLAVSNVVANAVTYSPPGSRVVVGARPGTTEQGRSAVEITVSDQGSGIPADEIDRIFERFYRVDPARHRSTGGTGLGLSIVKHVVASHGGDIAVWSVEGQGSSFTLRFPRHEDRKVRRTAPRDRRTGAGPTADSPGGLTADSRTGLTADSPTGPTADSPTGPTADSPTGPTADSPTGPTADAAEPHRSASVPVLP